MSWYDICIKDGLHCDVVSLLIDNILFLRFKFDDERVTKEDMKRALEEQYGGEEEVRYITNITFWCYVYCYP